MSPIKSIHYQAPLKLRPQERRILLTIGDLITTGSAFFIALYLWALDDIYLDFNPEILTRIPTWFYFLPVFFIILLSGLYEEKRAADLEETLRGTAFAALISLGVYLLIYFLSDKALPRRGVAYFFIGAVVLTLLWRMLYIRVFTAPQFLRRVLLVGCGETGQMILRIFNEMVPQPFILIGIIDDDPEKISTEIAGHPVLSGSDNLLKIIAERGISDLIVAISGKMQGTMFQALLDAQEAGVEITRMPVAYEELLGRIPIRYLEADWILRSFVDQMRANVYYEIAKRAVDLLGALVGFCILLPLLPFIALAILLDSGFPIFYSQIRMGKGGQLYRIYKFRTMNQNAEPDGQPKWAEENDSRATRVGLFLRKTHLDEMPQFFNVLRGEMSLVGPRAERPELVDWFQQHVPFYRARLLVKPGITGWAQVNQVYAASIPETIEKLEYDLFYIKRRNLILDFNVLLRTPSLVLGLRGR
jgi:exopolysaccharide biosynthesis polyprenyl glycosylphosphotransferase